MANTGSFFVSLVNVDGKPPSPLTQPIPLNRHVDYRASLFVLDENMVDSQIEQQEIFSLANFTKKAMAYTVLYFTFNFR